jgi:hypothetical protein
MVMLIVALCNFSNAPKIRLPFKKRVIQFFITLYKEIANIPHPEGE